MIVETLEPIRLGIEVRVSPERAWEVFTGELGSWWPTETHSVSADGQRVPDRVVVEPWAGGEIYEQLGEVRHHWARITVWEPPTRLVYTWRVNPGNPATEVEVLFSPTQDGTRVALEHRGWEAYAAGGAAVRANYGSDGGWVAVLGRFELHANARS